MSENHPNGYLKYPREPIGKRDPEKRIDDYQQIWKESWEEELLQQQGERCMDCGVPTCTSGCPIGNIIPDWNDLVYRGNWKQALKRLHATNNFPEFTGYTCPAPCENSCVLALNTDPVAIKSIERSIVDKGWEEGWIVPEPPKERTKHKIAVIGSGPAGLAAAQQLNRAGHNVTVFERDDEIGGLMTYGIPDFKFAKKQVNRRVDQLRKEGVEFRTSIDVGNTVQADEIFDSFDATCIAVGAQKHKDVSLDGRDLRGIHFAMEYLIQENRNQSGKPVQNRTSAQGKNVVVLGGGDTGADCVATAHRQGARQVVQISINPQKPFEREDTNPWPHQPQTYKKTYAIEEGGVEEFSVNTVRFIDTDSDGYVDALEAERVEWEYDKNRRRIDKKVIDADLMIPADLVLIAIGFSGPEAGPFAQAGIELNANGTFRTDENMMTNLDGVFATGDARLGASLVVWAIGEGRDAARNIDRYLQGFTYLPASIHTANPMVFR